MFELGNSVYSVAHEPIFHLSDQAVEDILNFSDYVADVGEFVAVKCKARGRISYVDSLVSNIGWLQERPVQEQNSLAG